MGEGCLVVRVPAVGEYVPRVCEGHRLQHVAREHGDHHRDREHHEHVAPRVARRRLGLAREDQVTYAVGLLEPRDRLVGVAAIDGGVGARVLVVDLVKVRVRVRVRVRARARARVP